MQEVTRYVSVAKSSGEGRLTLGAAGAATAAAAAAAATTDTATHLKEVAFVVPAGRPLGDERLLQAVQGRVRRDFNALGTVRVRSGVRVWVGVRVRVRVR